MSQYLDEVSHAARVLVDAIWFEDRQLARLRPELARLAKHVEEEYASAEAIQRHAESADDVMLGAGRYWENYFGADKERHTKEVAVSEIEDAAAAHRFSIASLSAALLQYAKQGISIVHGDLASSPVGRTVLGIESKNVIWQARNQALHWEEGNFRPPVVNCFTALAAADSRFGDFRVRNCAFDVVDVLGWKNIEAFLADMRLLA